MNYLTKKLKRDIKKGGIVIAPRRSGKGYAVLKLLLESDDFILVCANSEVARQLQKDINEKVSGNKLIYGPKDKIPVGKKIIVDEFFHNPYFSSKTVPDAHCLLGTIPKEMVVYNRKGEKTRFKKEEILKVKIKKVTC